MSRRLLHLFVLQHNEQSTLFQTIHLTTDGVSGMTLIHEFELTAASQCILLKNISFPFGVGANGKEYVDSIIKIKSQENWKMVFGYSHYFPRMDLPPILQEWISPNYKSLETIPIVGHDIILVGLLIDLEKKSVMSLSGNADSSTINDHNWLMDESTPTHIDSRLGVGNVFIPSVDLPSIKALEGITHSETHATESYSLPSLQVDEIYRMNSKENRDDHQLRNSNHHHDAVTVFNSSIPATFKPYVSGRLEQSNVRDSSRSNHFLNELMRINNQTESSDFESTENMSQSWNKSVSSILNADYHSVSKTLNFDSLNPLNISFQSNASQCLNQALNENEICSYYNSIECSKSSQISESKDFESSSQDFSPSPTVNPSQLLEQKEYHSSAFDVHSSLLTSPSPLTRIDSTESLDFRNMRLNASASLNSDNENNNPNTSVSIRLSKSNTEKLNRMTLEDLSPYFRFRIEDAAKMLHVGVTVLKKRCRKFGIQRWPQRKINSLSALILSINRLNVDPEGSQPLNAHLSSAVSQLQEQRRKITEKPEMPLTKRTLLLRQSCFKAMYKKRKLQQQNGQMVRAP